MNGFVAMMTAEYSVKQGRAVYVHTYIIIWINLFVELCVTAHENGGRDGGGMKGGECESLKFCALGELTCALCFFILFV